jgi:hypothetical protein
MLHAELPGNRLELGTLGSVADDRQRHAFGQSTERADREVERLARGWASDEQQSVRVACNRANVPNAIYAVVGHEDRAAPVVAGHRPRGEVMRDEDPRVATAVAVELVNRGADAAEALPRPLLPVDVLEPGGRAMPPCAAR